MENKCLKNIIILLALLSVSLSQANGQTNNTSELSLHQIGDQFSNLALEGKKFVSIDIKQLKLKYFFIHFQLDSQFRNQPVTLYLYISGVPNPIKTCSPTQIDNCYLSRDELSANTPLIILADSQSMPSYRFSIQTYWSDLQHLLLNTQTKFFFSNESQSQLYHLELNSADFHQLRIILKPQTIRTMFDKVKIYGAFGKDSNPSVQKHDFMSMHLWEDAEGVFLYGTQIKQNYINLLIIGEVQTVYVLTCQTVQKDHHNINIGENVHEYLQPGEDFLYHANFNTKDKKAEFDQYLLTFSGFSGRINVGFYLDKNKKETLNIQPFAYLSDAQYVFKKAEVVAKMKKGLYIYVHAQERNSVYSISFQGRNKTSAILLKERIYEFLQIDHNSQQFAYFQIFHWKDASAFLGDDSKVEYSVSLTNVQGDHEIEFRLCIKSVDQCTKLSTYVQSTKHHQAKVSKIGTKTTYTLQITKQDGQSLNAVEDVVSIVLIVKDRSKKKTSSIAAIQYRSQNKIQFLRQGKPIQAKIKQDQFKVYKYTNQDVNVKEVKIYMTEVSGKINVYSIREEPNIDNPEGKSQHDSVIIFTQDLAKKPIFIIVKGAEQAIFSIQIVPIHASNTQVSSFTLTEDLTFSLRVKPQGFEIVEVIPIFDAIYFQYKSSVSIMVCPMDLHKIDCEASYQRKISRTGQYKYEKFTDRQKSFKIMNPFDTQTAQVQVVYHSKDYMHCEHKQVGTLFFDTIQRKQVNKEQGNLNNCFNFPILQTKDVFVTLSRVDLGQLHYAIIVCNQILLTNSEVSQEHMRIQASKITQMCKNDDQKSITLMVSPHKDQKQNNKVVLASKIKYLIQYADERVITIPDGVAYDFQAKTTETQLKSFYYDLTNHKNTTIKLIQYSGKGLFAVKIIASGNKTQQLASSNYDYGITKSEGFYLNPTLTITEEQIKKKGCKQCSLIVKVFSNSQIGQKVHFGIQISQNHLKLQDHVPRQTYLPKDSYDFYSYTTVSSKTQGSLIIELDTHSLSCGTIYLSDIDYPDQKNHLAKQSSSQLIYKSVQAQKDYFISIKAQQDCPYSITISSTTIPITKLKRGTNSYLNLKKDQLKYYIVSHLEKKQFKIISVLQYGQTIFYMNKTTVGDIQAIMNKKLTQLDFNKFTIQGEHPNLIVMKQDNKQLQKDSHYLVVVQAKVDTQGYIFYGDEETSLSILTQMSISDQLTRAGEVFRGNYYGEGTFNLEITVLTGEINVDIRGQKDLSVFSKNFAQNKTSYSQKFTIEQSNERYYLRQPVHVAFRAVKQNSVYSFKFIRAKISGTKTLVERHIKAGHPNYLYLDKSSQSNTIIGNLTHNQQIFITIRASSKQLLSKMQIKGFLKDVQTKVQLSIVRNIMKIKFQGNNQGVHNYKINIKSPESISVTIYQNYGISLFAQDTQLLIQGENDYVLYPEGSILLDVFQCKAKATVLFSKSKSSLDTTAAQSLEMIGMPSQPHAIKIVNPGVTFLRISSHKSLARWLPMDSQKEKGMGYLNYDIGTITYESSLLHLNVNWDSVFVKRQTKTTIKSIDYVIIIGQSPQLIKDAINCQNYNDPALLYTHYSTMSSAQKSSLSIQLDKTQITQKYSQNNLFIGIVGDMQLLIPKQTQQSIQHYRFIYSTQQIPLQVFKEYAVGKDDFWLVLMLGTAAFLLFSATLYICVRKVAPLINRLKQGNALVEQTKEDKQFDVVPMSSDRNQIQNNNIQTEDNMK